MIRSRLLAGACLVGALAAGGHAAAQVHDPALSASRNSNQHQPSQSSAPREDIYDYWNRLEADGKLTPAAHEQLVQDAQTQLEAAGAKSDRSFSRATSGINTNQIGQAVSDFQVASKANDTQGQVDAAVKVNDGVVNTIVLPARTEAEIVIDDAINIQRDLLQKTAKAVTGKGAAAEQSRIAKVEVALDGAQRHVEAQLYQDRVKIEQTQAAMSDPATRRAVAAKINADLAAGRLVRTPDGGIAPGPNAPQPAEPPPAADQKPPPNEPPAPPEQTASTSDQPPIEAPPQPSVAPPTRPVKIGHGAGDNQGYDPSVHVPDEVKNAPPPSPPPPPAAQPPDNSAATDAAAASVENAMQQAQNAMKDKPERPPLPPPGAPTDGPALPSPSGGGTGTNDGGDAGSGADASQSPGGPGNQQPEWQGPIFSPPPAIRRDGRIGMTDVLDDQPETLASIVEWVKTSPNGPGDGLGGLDTTGTMADQGAHPPAANAADWQSFENGGTLTVAALAPIYAGYAVVPGQNGSSVILVPSTEVTGTPSAVATVPSLENAYVPSAVMTSLDLQPALCGR